MQVSGCGGLNLYLVSSSKISFFEGKLFFVIFVQIILEHNFGDIPFLF